MQLDDEFLQIKLKRSRYRPGLAQRVGRGISLLFHDRGTRRGWVVSSTPRPHFTPEKHPVPIAQEGVWALGPLLETIWEENDPRRIASGTKGCSVNITFPTDAYHMIQKCNMCNKTSQIELHCKPIPRNVYHRDPTLRIWLSNLYLWFTGISP